MYRTTHTAVAVAIIILAIADARAQGSVGLKAGTLGFGVEATYAFSDRWALRGGFNQYDYGFEDEIDGVEFDGDLGLSSVALLGDFRPFGSGFRLTGGAVINGNEVTAIADPAQTYEIGDDIYTLDEVGTLSALADFDSVSPYLGLGYDWDFAQSYAVSVDVGVLVQGAASVQIDSTGGSLSSDPDLLADLATEAELGTEDLEDFELYPVLSLGFHYRF